MRKIFFPHCVVLLFGMLFAHFSPGAPIVWTNTAGGSFGTPANWSPNQVPLSTDTALITNSGTYFVTNNNLNSVGSLTLGGTTGTQTLVISGLTLALGSASTGNAQGAVIISGGTLGGSGSLVLAGPMIWGGGTITNQVQFNGGTFSNSLTLNAGQVINTGTLSWTAPSLNTGNNSLVSNAPSGTINLTANLGEGNVGGTRTFANAGQLNVTASGTTSISSIFNNSGAVAVNSGFFNLSGGGTESGTFTIASGATNQFTSGAVAMNSGSSISGAGTWVDSGSVATFAGSSALSAGSVVISGGTVIFVNSSSLNLALLNLSNGILTGTNPVNVSGTFNWSGGTIATNLVQFNTGNFSGSLSLNNGGEVANLGTLSWAATTVNTGNGSIISNAPSGTINVTVNVSQGSFGGTHTFNNAGQLNVTVSGTANIADAFNNSGSVEVNGGTFDCSGGGTETGSFTAVSGATLEFGSGTFAINSGATLSGAGNFLVNGGVVGVNVPLNLSGTWTFGSGTATLSSTTTVSGNSVVISGGTVNFVGAGPWQPGTVSIANGTLGGTVPVTVQTTGGMSWSAGTILSNLVQFPGGTFSGSLALNAGEIINTGTLNWSATTVNTGNGSIISNAPAGIINLTANLSQGSFGPGHTFNNAGQLNVSVSGFAAINDVFNNTGAVAINSGGLNLTGGGTESGAITVASGATNEFGGGTYVMNSGSSISGLGVWLTAGGVETFVGSSSLSPAIATITSGTVAFNNSSSLNFPVFNLNGGTLEGTNPVMVSGPFTWAGGSLLTNTVQFTGGSFSNSLSLNNGGQVINTGTLNWSATSINTGNNSLISNTPSGTINLITNVSEGSLGGSRTFANAGQINAAFTGTTSIGDGFTNHGTVTFNSGLVNLSGSHSLAGGTLVFGISALNNYGSNSLNGVAALTGTLKSIFNGYLPSVGNTFNIMTYGSSSGSFTVTNLSPLAVWQVNQNAAALSITVVKLVPQLSWPNPTDIIYGNPLNFSQLDATATWNGTNVPGVFNYTPLPGTVLSSGSNQMLSVTFIPNDPSTFTNVATNAFITVQKAPLTVTANDTNKLYGQTFVFAGTEISTLGLVNGDSVTSATLTSPGTVPGASVAGSPYTINATNAVGSVGITNYNISYVTGLFTVNKGPLLIAAKNQTKSYGQVFTFAGTEFTPFGLQNSETVGSVNLTSTGAGATANVPGSPYPILAGGATGGTFDPNNYTVGYNSGSMTVTPTGLTITADNTNKIIGESMTFSGHEFVASGLQNSETVGSVTLTSTGAPPAAGVGAYSIVPSAPTGGTFSQNNYTNVFVNGTLNVLAPPPLSIKGNATQFVLTFQAMPGQSYQPQIANILTGSSFVPFGSAISGTNGTVNVTNNTVGPPNAFFRLQIQLGP